jgi:DNA-binding transcriptional LysR family regulator
MHRFVTGRIELAVEHAGTRGHVLDIARFDHPSIAHRVPMFQLAAQNVSNDFHVPMRMRVETHARHDEVVVDHPQRAVTHPIRIIVVREAESVIAVEPTMFGVAPFVRFSNIHHGYIMPRLGRNGERPSFLRHHNWKAYSRPMELRHLRYFVAVAEMENVSRAALKLHVSQPALSRQVRDLEDELGLTLLERSAKAVKLTEAGRVFLEEARAVLERADAAVRAARAVATGHRDELHVGYAPTLSARFLPGALRAFQTSMPQVRVKLHDLASEEIVASVHESKLQLGITVRPLHKSLRGLRFEELRREPIRLAVAPRHSFARRLKVSLEEAAKQRFVAYSRAEYPDYHEMLAEIFMGVKIKPNIVEEHDGVSSLISGLEACDGVAVVPESISCIAGVRLKLLALDPEPKPLSVGVVLRKDEMKSNTRSFLAALKASLS